MRASLTELSLCCLSLICAPIESPAAVRIGEEVLSQAERVKFDYRQHVSAAAAGDERAMRELFLFSRHTDAASSLAHGVALVDLFQTIGEEMPARVAKTLTSDDKRRITLIMEAGVAYGLRAAPEEWTDRFPRIAAALRPFRFLGLLLLIGGALVLIAVLLTVRRRLQFSPPTPASA
jgi:hypothetical protein